MTIKTDDIFRRCTIDFASLLFIPIVLTMATVDISGVMSSENESINITKDVVYEAVPNVTISQYKNMTVVPTPNVTVVIYQDMVETNIVQGDDDNDNDNGDDIRVPEFHVILWNYSADCGRGGLLGSCQPQKYIIPNNEVIQYVSSIMTINEKGKLLWEKCPFGGCGIFDSIYLSDDEQFDHPQYGDYWINPDYFFLNNMRGDCEDSAFAVASVLESKGVRTKIVGGYEGNGHIRDWAVEYKINGTYYRYYGGVPYDVAYGVQDEVGFVKRSVDVGFTPVIMFDKDSYYQDYKDNW